MGRAHDRLSAAYVGSNVGFWRGDRLARFRDGGVTDAGQARIDDRIQREQEASRCHRCGKSALYRWWRKGEKAPIGACAEHRETLR